jgi:MFS family permease
VRSPFEGLPREVGVLAAVAVAVAVGFGVVAPAIPEFARSFGVGKTAAGAVISAFALMRFASALGGGRLVDAVGERIILSSGIGIVAVSTGLAGLSQSYVQLLVLRGIGGVGSAMFTVSATALLFRVVDGSHRGRATGLFQSGFLIGGLLGPLVGGFLTEYSLRLPFFVYAVSLVAAGSIGAVFLRAARPRTRLEGDHDPLASEPSHPAGPPPPHAHVANTSLRDAWAHPGYRAAVAVNFAIGWSFFGVRASLIPLFVTEALHQRALWIGVGFLCSSLVQASFLTMAGRFVDRQGRRPAMIGGTLTAGAALAVLALSSALPLYLLAMTVIGLGGAFVGTAPGAVVGDIMRGRGGSVVAVFQMASDAGSITGPLAAGWLADTASFGAAFGACAVVMAAAAAMAVRMPETLVRSASGYPGSA